MVALGDPEVFDQYSRAVVRLLTLNNELISEDELIALYAEDIAVMSHIKAGKDSVNAILAACPDQFVRAGRYSKHTPEGNTKMVSTWADLMMDYELSVEDSLFDQLLCHKLRLARLNDLDGLLEHCLNRFFAGEKPGFLRFLILAVRQHGKELLSADQIQSIQEWIIERQKEPIGEIEISSKGKIKRVRDDNVTKLNQEQTALLVYCLRKTKVILTDEYLNNKEAGLAFSMLTGYSADTIRQDLNKSELSRIATSKNVGAITKVLSELKQLIDKEIEPEQ